MKAKVYIAGPMTGIEGYNFPAFDRARDHLIDTGCQPVSPADMDRDLGIEPDENGNIEDFDYRAALARCCAAVCECDVIYMLQGWESSKGARAEHALAHALDLEICYE